MRGLAAPKKATASRTGRRLTARSKARRGVAVASLAIASLGCNRGCGKAPPVADAAPAASRTTLSAADAGTQLGAPRPGMAWIPAGVLRAGTPADQIPRIAEEELPGTEFALGGFYIDLLPFPNEAGAIPTSNVTRDDAAKLCESKGKRLCTEFEWERACKGPSNTTYEYGDAYRAGACGTGVSAEEGARRPSGERVGCASAFGAVDMHGSVWEWTDSPWRRGAKTDLAVLRGGTAVPGELAGRCANAIGRNATSKGPTMGFRCCAGARNPQENELVVKPPAIPIERSMKPAEFAEPWVAIATKRWGSDATPFAVSAAWTWRPVANDELVIVSGCVRPANGAPTARRCGLLVVRAGANGPADTAPLTAADVGHDPAEVALFGDSRHLRMRGVDETSAYVREMTYVYGRVDLADIRRH